MTDAVGVGLHLAEVDAKVARTRTDRGRGEDLRILPGTGRGTIRRMVEGGLGRRRGLIGGRRVRHTPSTTGFAGGPPPRAGEDLCLLHPGVLRLILLGDLDLVRARRRGDHLALTGVFGLDHHQRRADRDLVADLAGQFHDRARHRRFHLDRRLVGHHVGDVLVFLDPVADGDVPGDDLGLGDAFADIGQLEGEASHYASFMIFLRASPMRTGPGK